MLGSSIAFSQKVPQLDVGELTAGRLSAERTPDCPHGIGAIGHRFRWGKSLVPCSASHLSPWLYLHQWIPSLTFVL
jgi:hypothetical protein